jgi:hypothetical protein
VALLAVAALVLVPAIALRFGCVGETCATAGGHPAAVPFCPLPSALKDVIETGFRSGRSPDVLGVTGPIPVVGGTSGASPTGVVTTWPALRSASGTGVPIVFGGPAFDGAGPVPAGTGLDAIAPTLAAALRFDRPHPEIRAGKPVPGVTTSAPPRLILEVAWKGVGSRDLARSPGGWPYLRSVARAGAGTLEGTTGSVPLDPAATLTTIGTGGLPFQHGITGTLLRNQDERVARAWSPDAPESVIATLADDYDQLMLERPLVGMVATDEADRGIVGDGWYVTHDSDPVRIGRGMQAQLAAVRSLLSMGFGRDAVPDILAVVMQGPLRDIDRELRRVVDRATKAARGSLLVAVAGTGEAVGLRTDPRAVPATTLVSEVDAKTGLSEPIVQAAAPGGLFLDEAALARQGVTGQVAQEALEGIPSPAGGPLVPQAFQGFAVSFARYC